MGISQEGRKRLCMLVKDIGLLMQVRETESTKAQNLCKTALTTLHKNRLDGVHLTWFRLVCGLCVGAVLLLVFNLCFLVFISLILF